MNFFVAIDKRFGETEGHWAAADRLSNTQNNPKWAGLEEYAKGI
jgi:hypothetical protein